MREQANYTLAGQFALTASSQDPTADVAAPFSNAALPAESAEDESGRRRANRLTRSATHTLCNSQHSETAHPRTQCSKLFPPPNSQILTDSLLLVVEWGDGTATARLTGR
jgi:hypothetical protein